MRKRQGKSAHEVEPTLTWVNWLKEDAPTVRARTADSSPIAGVSKERLVRRQRPTITGVPNRSLGLKPGKMRGNTVIQSGVYNWDEQFTKLKVAPKSTKRQDRAITINLAIPKVKLPKIHIPWLRVSKWAIGIGVVALVVVGTPHLLQYRAQKAKQAATNQQTSTPSYAPLKPANEGGSVAGAGYDGKRQMYKYDDVYNGVTMTISQQPLPDNLRANPKDIQKIAQSIGAKEKVVTTNGDAYISTDDKTATQRVVVAHRQLLIFIQSSKSMSNADWVAYIQKLE